MQSFLPDPRSYKAKTQQMRATQGGSYPTETYCKGRIGPASVFLVQFSESPQPKEETKEKIFWWDKGIISNLYPSSI